MLFVTPSTRAFILAVYAARARHRSGKIALIVSGLLLLATLAFSAWHSGGRINVAGIAVMAVVAVLVFAWARSRRKPPPGPDSMRKEGRPPGPPVQESA